MFGGLFAFLIVHWGENRQKSLDGFVIQPVLVPPTLLSGIEGLVCAVEQPPRTPPALPAEGDPHADGDLKILCIGGQGVWNTRWI